MTPVLICDDSSFARKQVARSLPPNWPVEVSYAGNGREALVAIGEGRGDIVFLDLTMPEMDGYQVLENVRARGHKCLVIVISGDIQPEAHARVKQLGALAFIQKPVDAAKLLEVLQSYGLY